MANSSYKRMVKYVRADPARYGLADPAKLKNFETLLVSLEKRVFRCVLSLLQAQ